jgi:ApaG protein
MSHKEQDFTAVTEGIRVMVSARYLPERSTPSAQRYAFAYTVRIRNEGPQAARLMSRHWIIIDAAGNGDEVRGDGVMGEQPLLKPGATFEYTSGVVLKTTRGTMRGTYRMLRVSGRMFDATIPPFVLEQPYSVN